MTKAGQREFDLGEVPEVGNRNGFYLMHRGWMNHKVFGRPVFTRAMAWCWLIENAQWSDEKWDDFGKTIHLRRGQQSVSMRDLAAAWQWSRSAVDRFITRLKTEHMIGTTLGNHRMVITICNYEYYQSGSAPDKSETGTTSGTTLGQPWDINKEGKERKEKKEEREAPPKHTNGVKTDLPARADITARGTRLANDWVLPKEWADWAWSQGHQMPELEGDIFRDHWISQSGAKGIKTDWQATWRNWIRRDLKYERRGPTQKETADEARERRRAPAAAAVARRMGAGLPGGSAED